MQRFLTAANSTGRGLHAVSSYGKHGESDKRHASWFVNWYLAKKKEKRKTRPV